MSPLRLVNQLLCKLTLQSAEARNKTVQPAAPAARCGACRRVATHSREEKEALCALCPAQVQTPAAVWLPYGERHAEEVGGWCPARAR